VVVCACDSEIIDAESIPDQKTYVCTLLRFPYS
jgi:hypothetical protein